MADWDNMNFVPEEFECRHCANNPSCPGHSKDVMDDGFLNVLQEVRNTYGRPMHVSSGYRCERDPVEAGKIARGGKPGSHYSGKACDIAVTGASALYLVRVALNHTKVTGVGIQQKGPHNTRFIHIDTLTTEGLRPNIWSY